MFGFLNPFLFLIMVWYSVIYDKLVDILTYLKGGKIL